MLTIKNLLFAHPGQPAPYTFSFEMKPGEILVVTGTSGAGKSTLLDLLGGFLMGQSGTITYDGKALTHLPPEKRPVSILFQSDNLFDHLSVAKNLGLGLPQKLDPATRQSRITKALAEVGLDGLEKRRASNLSGGQKQRVALARTLLHANPIVLLDEPFNALDPETVVEMRALLKALVKKHQWCVVLVSHDPDDIASLATHHMRLADLQLNPVL